MGHPHSGFAMKNDGTVWVCGSNSYGQLGLGDKNNRNIFTKIDVVDVESIFGGAYHTVILKKDGTLWGSGYNFTGCLGLGDSGAGKERTVFTRIDIDNVKQIACGGDYTFVLKKDGTVWSTGGNRDGQLGLGNSGAGTEKNTFTRVNIENVSSIHCGYAYTMVVKNDGTVWGCGNNDNGQLGTGDKLGKNIFTKVDIDNDNVKNVYCGSLFAFILKDDGTVWSCGSNQYGQLGLGDEVDRNTFTKVDLSDIKGIHCGDRHIFILKNDGTVWSCGSNQYGQLGLGDETHRNVFIQVNVGSVKQVSCGDGCSYILKNDGTILTTGFNQYGQLGLGDNGSTTHRNTFTKVDIDSVESLHNKEVKNTYYYQILKNNNKYITFLDSRFEKIGDMLPTSETIKEKGMKNLSVILEEQPEKQSEKACENLDVLGDGFIDKCIINKSDYRSIKEISIQIAK